MSGILGALASVATAMAAQATARTVKRAAWTALGVLFILIGVGFALAAGYDALAISYGPRTAKAISAGVFVLIGLIFMGVARYGTRSRRRTAQSGESTTAAVAFAMGLLSGLGRRR